MNEKAKAIAQAMASIQNRLRHVYNQGFEDGRKAERKTGRWIKRLLTTEPFTIYGYDCPFCEFGTATNSFNFCPHCGAKMEVDE